jgi:hypothetical protein
MIRAEVLRAARVTMDIVPCSVVKTHGDEEAPLKRWSVSTTLRQVTSPKMAIFIDRP